MLKNNELDHARQRIVSVLKLRNDYLYSYTTNVSAGVIWQWILHESNWRDKDFKWRNNTFFFNNKEDYLLFLLRWS